MENLKVSPEGGGFRPIARTINNIHWVYNFLMAGMCCTIVFLVAALKYGLLNTIMRLCRMWWSAKPPFDSSKMVKFSTRSNKRFFSL